MDDKTLNKMLDSHVAPAPNSNLASRILAASADNTVLEFKPRIARPFMKRFAPMAASLLAVSLVGYTFFEPIQNNETEIKVWQEAALDLGFDDIYSWVESEDASAQ